MLFEITLHINSVKVDMLYYFASIRYIIYMNSSDDFAVPYTNMKLIYNIFIIILTQFYKLFMFF